MGFLSKSEICYKCSEIERQEHREQMEADNRLARARAAKRKDEIQRETIKKYPELEPLYKAGRLDCIKHVIQLQKARELERSGKYQMAVTEYDELLMSDDAARIRRILMPPFGNVEKIVERQIIKVKCRYCGSLNDYSRRTCEACGANL
jgi:hypothetical protein